MVLNQILHETPLGALGFPWLASAPCRLAVGRLSDRLCDLSDHLGSPWSSLDYGFRGHWADQFSGFAHGQAHA
jgi:hypothetical protein